MVPKIRMFSANDARLLGMFQAQRYSDLLQFLLQPLSMIDLI